MCLIFFNRLTFLGTICLIDQFPAYSTFHQMNLRIIPPKKQKNDQMIDEFYANKSNEFQVPTIALTTYYLTLYSATGILNSMQTSFYRRKAKRRS